jgi:hypothetical protein
MKTIVLKFDQHVSPKGNIFDELLNLEAENNKQLALTELVNNSTSTELQTILSKIQEDLNVKLSKIGFNFNHFKVKVGANGVLIPTIFGKDGTSANGGVAICLEPISESREGTRYTTYYGKYRLRVGGTNIFDYYKNPNNLRGVEDLEEVEENLFRIFKQRKGLI